MITRRLTSDQCPDCKGVGGVRLEQGEMGDPTYDLYHLGYKKCERCGGSGEIDPQQPRHG